MGIKRAIKRRKGSTSSKSFKKEMGISSKQRGGTGGKRTGQGSGKLFKRAYKQYKYGKFETGAARIFPLKATTKLIYGAGYNQTITTGGTMYFNSFAGNSMYDPQISVGGNQPAGFDEMSALYDKWVVYSSTCEATIYTLSTGKSCHAWMWSDTKVPSSYVVPLTAPTLWQNPQVQHRYISNPNATGVAYYKLYRTTKALFPNKDIEDDENFWGTSAANPTNLWYWNFAFMSDYDNSAVRYVVQIKYYAKWYEPSAEVVAES